MLWHREIHITHRGTEKLSWTLQGLSSWPSDRGNIPSSQSSSTLVPRHRYCAKKLIQYHWNGNVVILMKFSSMAALKVVILTTFSAANDEDFVKMTTFSCQWYKNGILPVWRFLLWYKTILPLSYFHTGISYTRQTSLHWSKAPESCQADCGIDSGHNNCCNCNLDPSYWNRKAVIVINSISTEALKAVKLITFNNNKAAFDSTPLYLLFLPHISFSHCTDMCHPRSMVLTLSAVPTIHIDPWRTRYVEQYVVR